MKLALLRVMIRSFNAGTLVLVLALLDSRALRGQGTDSAASSRAGLPPAVFSIGQPPIWRQQLSAQGSLVTNDGRSGATLSYGVFHSFNKPPIAAFNPV